MLMLLESMDTIEMTSDESLMAVEYERVHKGFLDDTCSSDPQSTITTVFSLEFQLKNGSGVIFSL